jgi:hypothetical protein
MSDAAVELRDLFVSGVVSIIVLFALPVTELCNYLYCYQGYCSKVICVITFPGWTTGRSSFDPRQRRKDFSSSLCPDRLWGPPSLLYIGYRGPFPGGKARPGRDVDHSPLISDEVENE